jgi:hypothetical protein
MPQKRTWSSFSWLKNNWRDSSALKIEVIYSFETSVNFHLTAWQRTHEKLQIYIITFSKHNTYGYRRQKNMQTVALIQINSLHSRNPPCHLSRMIPSGERNSQATGDNRCKEHWTDASLRVTHSFLSKPSLRLELGRQTEEINSRCEIGVPMVDEFKSNVPKRRKTLKWQLFSCVSVSFPKNFGYSHTAKTSLHITNVIS